MTSSNFAPNYLERMDAARPGMLADTELKSLITANVETDPGIPFGKVVQRGSRAGSCKADLAGITKGSYLGITVMDRGGRASYPNGFPRYESARIARKGKIWVSVAGAIALNTEVAVAADGTFVASGTAGSFALPNATFVTSTTGAGLALIRLD